MKIYKMQLAQGSDFLCVKYAYELEDELESLEVGTKVGVEIVEMTKEEIESLGEFEGF